MKFPLLLAVVAVAAGLVASNAIAHDDAYLDAQKAPNGGQLRMAGPYHYELVTDRHAAASKESLIVVYVTDHGGTPVSTNGATGVANVLAGKDRVTVKLAPDGGNRMKGVGRYAWTTEAKAVVAITLSGTEPLQARFTASTTRSDASTGSGHAH